MLKSLIQLKPFFPLLLVLKVIYDQIIGHRVAKGLILSFIFHKQTFTCAGVDICITHCSGATMFKLDVKPRSRQCTHAFKNMQTQKNLDDQAKVLGSRNRQIPSNHVASADISVIAT